jgi:hypothetical protein
VEFTEKNPIEFSKLKLEKISDGFESRVFKEYSREPLTINELAADLIANGTFSQFIFPDIEVVWGDQSATSVPGTVKKTGRKMNTICTHIYI